MKSQATVSNKGMLQIAGLIILADVVSIIVFELIWSQPGAPCSGVVHANRRVRLLTQRFCLVHRARLTSSSALR